MVGTWKLVRAVARDGSGATLPEPWCWRRIRRCGSSQRAFAAEYHPRRSPAETGDAKDTEGPVPEIIHDEPVEQQQRHHYADAGSLRDDRGGQCAELVGKPFVGRMQCHRISRSLAGAEGDPAGDQRHEPYRPEHRKLGQCPDEAHGQQRPARLHPIDDEAGNDRRNRKQQEEAPRPLARCRSAETQ